MEGWLPSDRNRAIRRESRQPAAEPRLAIMVLRARKVAGKPTVVIAVPRDVRHPVFGTGDRTKRRCSTEEPRRAPPGWLEGGGTSSSPPRAFGATAVRAQVEVQASKELRSRLDHPAIACSRLYQPSKPFEFCRDRNLPDPEAQGSSPAGKGPMTAVTPPDDRSHPAVWVEVAENERFHRQPPSLGVLGSRRLGVMGSRRGRRQKKKGPDDHRPDPSDSGDSWTPRRRDPGRPDATAP